MREQQLNEWRNEEIIKLNGKFRIFVSKFCALEATLSF